ncbi:DUF664 domain-containing protein [Streptomyces aureus]
MAGRPGAAGGRHPGAVPPRDGPRGRDHRRHARGRALAWWPHHLFGPPHLHSHRDVLLHVITETACHAGHLDAARELIDGRRWLVLTEGGEADRL